MKGDRIPILRRASSLPVVIEDRITWYRHADEQEVRVPDSDTMAKLSACCSSDQPWMRRAVRPGLGALKTTWRVLHYCFIGNAGGAGVRCYPRLLDFCLESVS